MFWLLVWAAMIHEMEMISKTKKHMTGSGGGKQIIIADDFYDLQKSWSDHAAFPNLNRMVDSPLLLPAVCETVPMTVKYAGMRVNRRWELIMSTLLRRSPRLWEELQTLEHYFQLRCKLAGSSLRWSWSGPPHFYEGMFNRISCIRWNRGIQQCECSNGWLSDWREGPLELEEGYPDKFCPRKAGSLLQLRSPAARLLLFIPT